MQVTKGLTKFAENQDNYLQLLVEQCRRCILFRLDAYRQHHTLVRLVALCATHATPIGTNARKPL